MSNRDAKNAVKGIRKQKRAQHRIARDLGIVCSEIPTKYLMVCNAGLVTGLRRETLEDIIDSVVSKYDLIMPPGKSYCFIQFISEESAEIVYNKVHGRTKLKEKSTPLYLQFTLSVPESQDDEWNSPLPPGLKLIEDFISEEQENALLRSVDWKEEGNLQLQQISVGSVSSELKHRQVKHFGYEFRYDTNDVDPDVPIVPIPKEYEFLQPMLEKHGCNAYEYDQLTINHYLPGQGIPPHIDTHSPFEDTMLSLSLGSACVMDFKRDSRKVSVFLPPRSLLVMSGEARYAWTHGINPRHNDVIKTKDGVTTRERRPRTSFTFRKIRGKIDCCCDFPEYCDSTRQLCNPGISAAIARGLEDSYVHEVYEEITDHFSETRHKPWPRVAKFLEAVEKGGFLLDVGCGNGKYLYDRPDIFKMGCDRSFGLTEVCRTRGFQVLRANILQLPYKNNTLDAAISIAVIHHLSTHERRKGAIAEIIRVLKPGGRCLIYVWAKEQSKDSDVSSYIKLNPSKDASRDAENSQQKLTEYGITLPIHKNRTEFTHTDVLVPWKKKSGSNFLRFYHVFEEGELAKLCADVPNATIEEIYYDQGNWYNVTVCIGAIPEPVDHHLQKSAAGARKNCGKGWGVGVKMPVKKVVEPCARPR